MRIYLAITFWGQEYRRYFLDFSLASLLAPGNLPAIADKSAARFLIATPDSDWAELQAEPTFIAAKKLISFEHVPFNNKSVSDAHKKMLIMSEAHRRLARRMFEDRAHGIFVYPDMIAATGFIGKLEALWQKGAVVVMFMNVRFTNEGLINEVRGRGLVRPGEPIALSSNELVRLTLRHMHSEMKRSGFESSYEDYGCSSYFWVVAPGEDLLFHCGSWIPSLIDYGSIDKHDDSTFESWTLDGDYVAKNFAKCRNIHFVRDTTELFMISFTPESTVHYSLAPRFLYRVPFLRTTLKVLRAHLFLYEQATMDWLTKDQFRLPVRFRGGNSPESQWRRVEDHAARIIGRIERRGNLSDNIVEIFCILPIRTALLFHSLYVNRTAIARRLNQVVHGDRVAWRRVTWRFRQTIYRLLGRHFRERQPTKLPPD